MFNLVSKYNVYFYNSLYHMHEYTDSISQEYTNMIWSSCEFKKTTQTSPPRSVLSEEPRQTLIKFMSFMCEFYMELAAFKQIDTQSNACTSIMFT